MGEFFAFAAAALSALASVLAWGARLIWGREFAAAKDETIKAKEAQLASKDETIRAKDAQIEGLTQRLEQERELNPMKIRDYFKSVKEQLEEFNNHLQSQLKDAQEKLTTLQRDIEAERSKAAGRQDQIASLVAERDRLHQHTADLKVQVEHLQAKRSESAKVLVDYEKLFQPTTLISEQLLRSWMGLEDKRRADLSKSLLHLRELDDKRRADLSESLSYLRALQGKPAEPKPNAQAEPKTDPAKPEPPPLESA